MDDKKSLVIIAFLIAIIIALGSFFLFLVSSGNTRPTMTYPVTDESETMGESESTDQKETGTTLEEKESTKAVIKEETKKVEEETKKTEETIKETSKTKETSSQTETAPIPQTTEPVSDMGTVLACSGTLEIIKPGDNGEGIVFHAKPQFDSATAAGNVIKKEGTYPVDGKIYVMAEDGKPYLMYKIGEYYVTGNENYVSFTSDVKGKGMANPEWIREYADGAGTYVTIYTLDDSHVVFDTGTENSFGKKNVLNETVATFTGSNRAEFEYIANDGMSHTGTITFKNVEGKEDVYEVVLNYTSPLWYSQDIGNVTELKVYN